MDSICFKFTFIKNTDILQKVDWNQLTKNRQIEHTAIQGLWLSACYVLD